MQQTYDDLNFSTASLVGEVTVNLSLLLNSLKQKINIIETNQLENTNSQNINIGNVYKIRLPLKNPVDPYVYFYTFCDVDPSVFFDPENFNSIFEAAYGQYVEENALSSSLFSNLTINLNNDLPTSSTNLYFSVCSLHIFRLFVNIFFGVCFNLQINIDPQAPTSLGELINLKNGYARNCSSLQAQQFIYYFPHLANPLLITNSTDSMSIANIALAILASQINVSIVGVQTSVTTAVRRPRLHRPV